MALLYPFTYILTKKDGLFSFSYKDVRQRYTFRYTNRETTLRYRFSLKVKGRRYCFSYLHRGYFGKYKFSYSCYDEIYYENPIVSLMYQYREVIAHNKPFELMFPSHELLYDTKSILFALPPNKTAGLYNNMSLLQSRYRGFSTDIVVLLGYFNGRAAYEAQDIMAARFFMDAYKQEESSLSAKNKTMIIPMMEAAGKPFCKPVTGSKTHILGVGDNKSIVKDTIIFLRQLEQFKDAFVTGSLMMAAHARMLLKDYQYMLGRLQSSKAAVHLIYMLTAAVNEAGIYELITGAYKNKSLLGLYGYLKLLSRDNKEMETAYNNLIMSRPTIDIFSDSLERLFESASKQAHYIMQYQHFLRPVMGIFNDTRLEGFLRLPKEYAFYEIIHMLSKCRKKADTTDDLHLLDKLPFDAINYYIPQLFEKQMKGTGIYKHIYKADKGFKNINNIALLMFMVRNNTKTGKYAAPLNLLEKYSDKRTFIERISFCGNRDITGEGQKLITVENIISFFDNGTMKDIFGHTSYTQLIRHVLQDIAYDKADILSGAIYKNAVTELFGVFERINEVSAYVSGHHYASNQNKQILLLNDIITAKDYNGVYVPQKEHELSLWKRFWFLYASDLAYDNKILPSADYPYEDKPIEFQGFDDLMPDNWQQIYPTTFWRKIDCHPIKDGTRLGIQEIPLAINIMVELVNVLILMWGRFYSAFWGWTGTQAVLGITAEVYKWIVLEQSIAELKSKDSKIHYERCYRWLRWEAEKVALMARNDMELRGNYYVGILLEEMINYMLDHHFDIMPIFQDVNKMDEWRRSFDRDLQHDITWVLNKVKGIRHKLIDGRSKKHNV